jgi:hypothetical protein
VKPSIGQGAEKRCREGRLMRQRGKKDERKKEKKRTRK